MNIKNTAAILFAVVCIFFTVFVSKVHGEEVSLIPYPSPPTYGVQQTVHGTLINASNTLTSPWGRHATSTHAAVTAMPNTWETTCIPPRRKAIIDDADVKIQLSWTSAIYLPYWNDRTSDCYSATQEWENWASKVTVHEYGHHTTTADYCVKPIIVGGWFTGVDSGAESSWLGYFQWTAARTDAQSKVRTKAILKANAITTYLDNSGPVAQSYHAQVGATLPRPDVSAECP